MQVYEQFHTRPGWRVVPRTNDYARDYASSTFCLAAPGELRANNEGEKGLLAES